jgi:hypothetical protein
MIVITTKDNIPVTDEMVQIARGYDFFTMYIDSYGQMKEAEEKNDKIMDRLKSIGVISIKRADD